MNNTRSGGDILIQMLVDYGVETAFCVPGESYLDALNSLYDHQDSIRVITCRQEGGASYMADAWGKITGKPGVCFVSRGPGASNAMVGIHTAFQDSTPVLMFVGQVARSDIGREAFQELDFTHVYGNVAKKVIRINDASRIPEQVSQAWHVASSGRPGPVIVELPEDMLTDEVNLTVDCTSTVHAPAPDPESMETLEELLADSKDPVILAGGAGWTPNASTLLQQFSEKHHIPVATVFRRTASFDNTHPNYIGELGIAANPKLVDRIQNADLLLVIGPRLGEMTTAAYTVLEVPNGIGPQQKFIHVHVSDEEINSVYRSDLGIVAQPELFLKAACNLQPTARDNLDRTTQSHQDYLDYMNAPRNEGADVRMDKIAEFLRENLDENSIITNGAGNYAIFTLRNYQYRKPGTQLATTNGSMGYGVPAAIAAKLARPESAVVSFNGDGCFLMNGQELATAVQYNLKILFLVVNNSCYGTIRSHQQRHYPERPVATTLNNPDFAALARAYGAFGLTVKKTNEFADAFEQAMAFDGPALIELQTDY